ncbi:MAG: MmgE/PrpD family protein [Rhizobiales bacterium]|nr:MmgE/PrpD family protein [Hyphomicrobiales bacterium]
MSIASASNVRAAATTEDELPPVTRLLAEEMLALDANEGTLRKAELNFLDYFSCALATRDLPWTRQALSVVGRWPVANGSQVIGTDLLVSPPDAAFLNGLMAAFTSRTDIHPSVSGHPCVSIFPVALALLGQKRVSGRDFLNAIVAGYEVMGRLGRLLVNDKFRSNFRSTSILGCVSASFTASRILGLDLDRAVNAVALASNWASGLQEWGHSGATEQFYQGANAARAATAAALLAEQGVDGSSTILEGKSGLVAAFGDRFRAAELLTRPAGERREIELTDIKRVAACTFVQAGVYATERLIEQHRFDPTLIEKVEVETYAAALNCPGVDNAGPIDGILAARMSMQHSVASVLVRQSVSDDNFFEYDNPAVGLVTRKVIVADRGDFTSVFPKRQAASVKVALSDGKTFSSTIDDVPSFEEIGVVERFRSVAKRVLSERQVSKLEVLVRNCATLDDVRPILDEVRTETSGIVSSSTSIASAAATASRAAISPVAPSE